VDKVTWYLQAPTATAAANWRDDAGPFQGRARGRPRRPGHRLRDGIHSGAIVLAFRRWKRIQVVPGRRYRTGIDLVEVESVDVVEPSSVDVTQARVYAAHSATFRRRCHFHGHRLCHTHADTHGDPSHGQRIGEPQAPHHRHL
jgi:hypothetical protein